MERWLSYKGTCHVILLAKLHDNLPLQDSNFSTSTIKVSLKGGFLTQVSLYTVYRCYVAYLCKNAFLRPICSSNVAYL